jgi:hypothetical protein
MPVPSLGIAYIQPGSFFQHLQNVITVSLWPVRSVITQAGDCAVRNL